MSLRNGGKFPLNNQSWWWRQPITSQYCDRQMSWWISYTCYLYEIIQATETVGHKDSSSMIFWDKTLLGSVDKVFSKKVNPVRESHCSVLPPPFCCYPSTSSLGGTPVSLMFYVARVLNKNHVAWIFKLYFP